MGMPADTVAWLRNAYARAPAMVALAAATGVRLFAGSDPRTDLKTLHYPEVIILGGRVVPTIHEVIQAVARRYSTHSRKRIAR